MLLPIVADMSDYRINKTPVVNVDLRPDIYSHKSVIYRRHSSSDRPFDLFDLAKKLIGSVNIAHGSNYC